MSDLIKNTIADKNWLVLGPGRTGSMCIVTLISTVMYEIYHNLADSDSSTIVDYIPNGKVIHSHNLNDLTRITATTEIILSIRNPAETSMSHVIRQHMGKTHLFGSQSVPLIPFYLDPDVFLHNYT